MATTLWAKHQYAKCFGNWLVSNTECSRCFLADNCEKRTKAKVEEKEVEDSADNGEAAEEAPITSLDYLLQRLEGKFDKEVADKGGGAKIHTFKKDGVSQVAVVTGMQGRIKVVAPGYSKVFGSLGSIEDVEAILAEINL